MIANTVKAAAICAITAVVAAGVVGVGGGCDAAGPALPAAGPNAIEMTVTSSPPGATVVVDGSPLGMAPAKVKLNPGPHRARASMSGYYPPPELKFQVGTTEPKEVTV